MRPRQAVQAVRVSGKNPIVHAASGAISEETKRLCQTLCGIPLREHSLINLNKPITCQRCVRLVQSKPARKLL